MSKEQIIQFFQENIDLHGQQRPRIMAFPDHRMVSGERIVLPDRTGKGFLRYDVPAVDVTACLVWIEWINEFRPLIVTLVVVSLVVLGMMLMFGKNKNHNVLTSILIFAVVATSSTFLFSTFNSWTIVIKDAVISGEGVADGTALINSNLYDLVYIDEQIGLVNMSEWQTVPSTLLIK